MSIVLQSSGGGSVTLQEPSTASNFTHTLPAATGTVVLSGTTPSLNGIAFPATQVASADANTLDDYEEGTWTPRFAGSGGSSGQVYGAQVGRYIKIGRLVFVKCNLILSTAGTNNGSYAWITGFPFTTEATQGGMSMSPLAGYFANFSTSIITFGGDMDPNTTYMYITYTTGATGSPTFAPPGFLASGCRVDFQACYEANA